MLKYYESWRLYRSLTIRVNLEGLARLERTKNTELVRVNENACAMRASSSFLSVICSYSAYPHAIVQLLLEGVG